MMSMTFEASSRVRLLFDFWDVHGPAGMLLSVLVVLLLTVFYELLKVSRVWLRNWSKGSPPPPPPSLVRSAPSPPSSPSSSSPCHSSSAALASSIFSESSLTLTEPPTPTAVNKWLHHGLQTGLHVLQVTLGYMLMLCVMSYNVWIFLGVVAGSVLGYFLAFPLLGQV